MKEYMRFLFANGEPMVSLFGAYNMNDSNNVLIKPIGSTNIFEVFILLVIAFLSILLTQKLLNYLPVVYFGKSRIIIKHIYLALIYGGQIGIIFLLFSDFIIILFLLVFINLVTPLFIIDNRIGYLPDVLTYPLLWFGVLYQIHTPNGNVVSAIYAVIISYLVMLMVSTLIGKKTQQPQMGRGDFKLVAACAAWLGVWQLPYFLGVAAGLGLLQYWVIYGVVAKKNQRNNSATAGGLPEGGTAKKSNAIPFGPALIISATIWLYLSIIKY